MGSHAPRLCGVRGVREPVKKAASAKILFLKNVTPGI